MRLLGHDLLCFVIQINKHFVSFFLFQSRRLRTKTTYHMTRRQKFEEDRYRFYIGNHMNSHCVHAHGAHGDKPAVLVDEEIKKDL